MSMVEIKVKMTTLSPLYTGEVRLAEKQAASINFPVRKTTDGRVLIQLKGHLRNSMERLFRMNKHECCDSGQSKSRACGKCYVCHMFGIFGKKGKLDCDFLITTNDKRMDIRETAHTRLNRQTGAVSDTFRAEEVVEGVVFTGSIRGEDITDADIEILRSVFKFLEQIGVGGWTSKGYGKVKFELEVVKNATIVLPKIPFFQAVAGVR